MREWVLESDCSGSNSSAQLLSSEVQLCVMTLLCRPQVSQLSNGQIQYCPTGASLR